MTTDSTGPAGLDIDAIGAKWRGYDAGFWVDEPPDDDILITTTDETPTTVARMEGDHARGLAELWANAGPETLRLIAEARRLRTLRDDIADAFDGLVMKVWRAAGEEHEPPADVDALVRRVAWTRDRLVAGRESDTTLRKAVIALTVSEAETVAKCNARIAAARREGAEAMREAAARAVAAEARSADARADRCGGDSNSRRAAIEVSATCDDLADAIRALPLPGGGS